MKKLFFSLSVFAELVAFSCTKQSATTGDVSYSKQIAPIMSASCTSCHSKYGSYAGVSADAYSISAAVQSGAMPRGSSLPATQITLIKTWVNQGSKNN